MSNTNVEPSAKEYLISFLESKYNIEREQSNRLIDMDELPDDARDLLFTKNKLMCSDNEVVGTLTEEFLSRSENLSNIINLNLSNVPTFKYGYIKQAEISREAEIKVRGNPQIATKAVISDEEFKSILGRIADEVEFLSDELDNCEISDELESQFRVILSLIRYAIDLKSSAHIFNAYRVLRYITAHKNISEGRQKHSYSRLGHKLDIIFDNENLIPDELYPYYEGNISDFVSVMDKAIEQN